MNFDTLILHLSVANHRQQMACCQMAKETPNLLNLHLRAKLKYQKKIVFFLFFNFFEIFVIDRSTTTLKITYNVARRRRKIYAKKDAKTIQNAPKTISRWPSWCLCWLILALLVATLCQSRPFWFLLGPRWPQNGSKMTVGDHLEVVFDGKRLCDPSGCMRRTL